MKPFFTITELLRSDTAKKFGIENKPTEEHLKNLNDLIGFLSPYRYHWEEWCKKYNLGNPAIRVSSGYRSKELNAKVGGSNTSVHSLGLAADLVPYNYKLVEFRKYTEDYLKGRMFDQCIFEMVDNRGVPQWIHIGLKSTTGLQRCRFMTYKNNKYTIINV
jgi:hypothetical protein